MTSMHISENRLLSFLEQMARIGATANGGCNRQALTQLDKQGRELFLDWCRSIGGEPRRDSMGNLFVRFSGMNNQLAPIFLGSHLDTQPTGGKYDGVYGVLGALEVMHTLADEGIQLQHPVDLVVWCNEEGARFSPAMVGSGVFAGVFKQEEIYQIKDLEGVSFYQALNDSEQLGELPCQYFPFHASLELHIEQGPILEAKNKSVGVVTGVQGMNWYEITLTGDSVHAGPTPMSMRNDPVQTLYTLLPELYQWVASFGEQARITVGRIQTYPTAPNTVPEKVIFTLDIRHPEQECLERMYEGVERLCREHQQDVGIHIAPLWESPAVKFADKCVRAVEQSCLEQNIDYLSMVSGAGHDSVYLSKVGPTGMVFVPCKDGISHNEAEHVDPEYLVAGANVLLSALVKIDTEKE